MATLDGMVMVSKAVATSSSSPERLIVLCDGTWCGPEHGTRTNIQLLAEIVGIDMDTGNSSREIIDPSRRLRAKYFNGIDCNYLTYCIGARADNIKQLCLEIYHYIARWYRSGTEVWLFGLGRGAYTLRLVVGIINNCGIVKDPNHQLCELVYQTYASPRKNDRPSSAQCRNFRKRASWDVATPIKVMILLDTIGSSKQDCGDTSADTTWPRLHDEAVPSVVEKRRLRYMKSGFQAVTTTSEDNAVNSSREAGCAWSRDFLAEPWNRTMCSATWSCAGSSNLSLKYTRLNDIHWQISFLKKSIRTPKTSTGSGDIYGSCEALLYVPFGRVITRLPIMSTFLKNITAILPLRDRRVPDTAANVIDFAVPNYANNEKSLAEMANITTQRYPSRTHDFWKTWKNYTAGSADAKTISWADDPSVNSTNGTKALQLSPKSYDSFESLVIDDTVGEDHASIASILSAHEEAEFQLRRQRSSSLLQNIVLTATDDVLMKAVIDQDATSVQDILTQKAADLAFDFEWLGELIELGYNVEEITRVLMDEEREAPWLLVSGGNFGKRTLKLSKRLEGGTKLNGDHER
ncbi:hypothetical protein E4T42_08324 [Aureobasidium subglaciale]|nr:hypothetical protein E4T42_08324 [Aureobasidium subglaciale]